MHLPCIYQKPNILSLFKINTLKFTMYILTILTCPLETYVISLQNPTSINIFFTIDHKRSQVFFKEKAKIQFQRTLRSSHQRCAVRKSVNFAKFTGKHLFQSFFFNKVPGFRTATLLKKRLWRRWFLVNFSKLLRTPFCRTPLDDCFRTFSSQ